MKNYLKMLCGVLALLLVFAGCAKSDVSGSISAREETVTVPVGTVEQTEAVETTEAAQTEAVETTEAVAEKPVSLGRMEDGTYTNTYAGFACDLDSNWTYYGAEELQELPANIKELFEGTEVGEAMEGLDMISDMIAENVNDLTSINVIYQKLSMQERLLYAALTEEEIVDATLAQSDAMIESYTQAGMDVTSMEKVKVTFLGEEHTGIKTVGSTNGVDFYIVQVFNFHAGQYGVTLTMSSYLEDNTESLLAMFYAAE